MGFLFLHSIIYDHKQSIIVVWMDWVYHYIATSSISTTIFMIMKITSIINNSVEKSLTAGESYFLEKLKRLYSQESYTIGRRVHIYLHTTINTLCPDFIIIDSELGVSIIEIKDWDRSFLKEINKTYVISSTNEKLDNPLLKVKRYKDALGSILANSLDLIDQDGDLKFEINAVLALQNIDDREFSEIQNQFPMQHAKVLTKTLLRSAKLGDIFAKKTHLSKDEIKSIRWLVFPENRIIKAASSIAIDAKSIHGTDIVQENTAKSIPYGHSMLSGVPGSGKTIILLSKALYLLKNHPSWRIIIVTYTNALQQKLIHQIGLLQQELNLLHIDKFTLEVKTFHKLCYSLIGKPNQPYEMSNDEFFDYFWPEQALKKASPVYDAVFIDEYQDFHKPHFELCKKICRRNEDDSEENILMAGDFLQRIYKPNWSSWQDIGINLIGFAKGTNINKSKILKKSYRVDGNHIDLALSFLALNKKLKNDVLKMYDMPDGYTFSYRNTKPDAVNMIYGDIRKVVEAVEEMIVKFGFNALDFLILCHTNKQCATIHRMFRPEIKDFMTTEKGYIPNKGNVTTYHSSKGLEGKICICTDIDQFDDSEEQQYRLMYVGMTRASSRLVLHACDSSKGFAHKIEQLMLS